MEDKELRVVRGMVVTDLDGTLLDQESNISKTNLRTMNSLPSEGVLRVVATGRSLYSARRVLWDRFPLDYLIFSSGAGVVQWGTRRLIKKHTMTGAQVKATLEILLERGMDFMVHRPIPRNHYFVYYQGGRNNPDFLRRLELYRGLHSRGDSSSPRYTEACQILAIEPAGGDSIYPELIRSLNSLKVIRTTSPIDGKSTWIEIFPPSVSKARAAQWIGDREGIAPTRILAVGNDYNDLDLLAWANHSYIVDNAPRELKGRYKRVSANHRDGFTEAVNRWLSGG